MKPGLPSTGRKTRAALSALFAADSRSAPTSTNLKPAAQGTVTGPRLSLIPQLPEDDYALVLEGYLEIPETGVWVARDRLR